MIHFNKKKALPGFRTHSCLLIPPKVPSQPLEVLVQPGFIVQHHPSEPHHGHFP